MKEAVHMFVFSCIEITELSLEAASSARLFFIIFLLLLRRVF